MIGAIAKMVAGLGSKMPQLAKAGEMAASAVGKTVGGMESFGKSVMDLPKQLSSAGADIIGMARSLIDPFSALVAKVDPGLVQIVNLALDDLTAVVGEMVIPYFEIATKIVREFADRLDGFTPIIREIMKVVGLLMEQMYKVVFNNMKIMMPVIKAIAEVFNTLVPLFEPVSNFFVMFTNLIGGFLNAFSQILVALTPIIEQVVHVLTVVLNAIVKFMNNLMKKVNEFLESIGLKPIFNLMDGVKGDSVNKSVQSASYSSIEALGRKTSLASFSLGAPISQNAKFLGGKVDQLNETGNKILQGIEAGKKAYQSQKDDSASEKKISEATGAIVASYHTAKNMREGV